MAENQPGTSQTPAPSSMSSSGNFLSDFQTQMQYQMFQLQRMVQEIRNKSAVDNSNVQVLRQELADTKERMKGMEGKLGNLQRVVANQADSGNKLKRKINDNDNNAKGQMEALKLELDAMKESMQNSARLIDEIRRSGGGIGGGNLAIPANLTQMFGALERQLGMYDVKIAENDVRIQVLETTSYTGKLLWKIRDFNRRREDAKKGKTLSIYSQPFYTSRYGYKMCLPIYLNGDGMGNLHVYSFTGESAADLPTTAGQLEIETEPESTTMLAVRDDECAAVETGEIPRGIPDNELLQLAIQYTRLDADTKIGQDGGLLALDESSVTIPPNSLVDTRNLSIFMLMDFQNLGLPADMVPISPYLGVKFRGKLHIPAKVRVPTWFKAPKDAKDAIKIYKRCRNEENKFFWCELQNKVEVHNDILEFEVYHFCGFIAMIKSWLWGYGEMKLSHGLFHHGRNFLSVFCYRSPESLFVQIIAKLEKLGYKEIHQDFFLMNTKQDVPIKMECFDAHLHEFRPKQHLLTPSAIKINQTARFSFILRHLIEPRDEVDINYIVNDFQAPYAVKLPPVSNLQNERERVSGRGGDKNEFEGSSSQTTLSTGQSPTNVDSCAGKFSGKDVSYSFATPITDGRPTVVHSVTKITAQNCNINGQMTSTHGTSDKVIYGPQAGNEPSGQAVGQQGCEILKVIAGTYNSGQMTLNQSDTTTQVFKC